jgi:hypothetical protein
VALVLVPGLFVLIAACEPGISNPASSRTSSSVPPSGGDLETGQPTIEAQIESFCGACHLTPRPEHFARKAWREEVEQGYQFYFQSERSNLHVPVMSEVIAYYERHAPEELPLPPARTTVDPGGLTFLQSFGPEIAQRPAVAHLHWTQLSAEKNQVVIVSDMRSGEVRADHLKSKELPDSQLIAKLPHPCHAVACDLDQDGERDLLVADLGSFDPADHDNGRVVWLRQVPGGRGEFQSQILASKLGRVADVQPADWDGDRDLDLVVAEFGWRRTGRVLCLENLGGQPSAASFRPHVVDPRHGAIHVPVLDMNQDGHPDFVALLAQEHESVELYLNSGTGIFHPQRLFAGDRPSFGSTGISLADLDQDGDQDILFTNGDMMDDFQLQTCQAVHWLENEGSMPWTHHVLVDFPGVHRALAADMDGDGDQDVVACALVPARTLAKHPDLSLASLIWLEQRDAGEYIPHTLELNRCHHAAMELGDFDADGDTDLIVGNFITGDEILKSPYTIWWNEGRNANRSQSSMP